MKTLRKVNNEKDIKEIKKKFFVFDTETSKLEPQPKNFVFGVVYGHNYTKVIHSVEGFIKEFKNKRYDNKIIFAHNAEFDLLTIYGNVYTQIDNSAIFNGKFISCKIDKVTFADSMNIFPASVEKIGKTLGMEKIENKKISSEGLTKKNKTTQDINYCIRDCEIVYEALLKIFESVGKIKITVAGLTMHNFRNKYMTDEIVYNELANEFFDSYYGGRTECFKLGEVNCKVYDINSMYPDAMKKIKFPDVRNLKKECKVDLRYLNYLLSRFEGMAKVKVRHKKTYFGYLPKREEINRQTKLIFPVGEFETTVNFNELRFAIKQGVIELLGVEYVVYGNPTKSPFIKFVDEIYKEKKEAPDLLSEYISKLRLNSLYGRFAMRTKFDTTYFDQIPYEMIEELRQAEKFYQMKMFSTKRDDCFLITENKKFENSFFAIPTFSSYITSHARVELLKSLIENEGNKVCYCDTDSIFLEGEFIGNMGDELGEWKKEEKQVIEINGLKNYVSIIDGEIKESIKGVSKRAVKDGNVYTVQKYYKTKEALRRNKEAGEAYEQKKIIKRKYDKRVILPDNNTKPIEL